MAVTGRTLTRVKCTLHEQNVRKCCSVAMFTNLSEHAFFQKQFVWRKIKMCHPQLWKGLKIVEFDPCLPVESPRSDGSSTLAGACHTASLWQAARGERGWKEGPLPPLPIEETRLNWHHHHHRGCPCGAHKTCLLSFSFHAGYCSVSPVRCAHKCRREQLVMKDSGQYCCPVRKKEFQR